MLSLVSSAVMPRLDRGIQYSRGFSINSRLWNTGSPGQAGRWHCV